MCIYSFRPLVWRLALFEYTRAPLNIETDIPFCRSILQVMAVVVQPLSPLLFALRSSSNRHLHTPPPSREEVLQAARSSRRRLLVFSVSVPSAVGREPRVPVSCCVARGGCRASLRAACKQSSVNRQKKRAIKCNSRKINVRAALPHFLGNLRRWG